MCWLIELFQEKSGAFSLHCIESCIVPLSMYCIYLFIALKAKGLMAYHVSLSQSTMNHFYYLQEHGVEKLKSEPVMLSE